MDRQIPGEIPHYVKGHYNYTGSDRGEKAAEYLTLSTSPVSIIFIQLCGHSFPIIDIQFCLSVQQNALSNKYHEASIRLLYICWRFDKIRHDIFRQTHT